MCGGEEDCWRCCYCVYGCRGWGQKGRYYFYLRHFAFVEIPIDNQTLRWLESVHNNDVSKETAQGECNRLFRRVLNAHQMSV